MIPEEDLGGMDSLSAESVDATDAALHQEEARLIGRTSTDLEKYRLQVGDDKSFNKLLAAVDASARANDSKAELKQRLTALGEGVVKAAGTVAKLASKGIV